MSGKKYNDPIALLDSDSSEDESTTTRPAVTRAHEPTIVAVVTAALSLMGAGTSSAPGGGTGVGGTTPSSSFPSSSGITTASRSGTPTTSVPVEVGATPSSGSFPTPSGPRSSRPRRLHYGGTPSAAVHGATLPLPPSRPGGGTSTAPSAGSRNTTTNSPSVYIPGRGTIHPPPARMPGRRAPLRTASVGSAWSHGRGTWNSPSSTTPPSLHITPPTRAETTSIPFDFLRRRPPNSDGIYSPASTGTATTTTPMPAVGVPAASIDGATASATSASGTNPKATGKRKQRPAKSPADTTASCSDGKNKTPRDDHDGDSNGGGFSSSTTGRHDLGSLGTSGRPYCNSSSKVATDSSGKSSTSDTKTVMSADVAAFQTEKSFWSSTYYCTMTAGESIRGGGPSTATPPTSTGPPPPPGPSTTTRTTGTGPPGPPRPPGPPPHPRPPPVPPAPGPGGGYVNPPAGCTCARYEFNELAQWIPIYVPYQDATGYWHHGLIDLKARSRLGLPGSAVRALLNQHEKLAFYYMGEKELNDAQRQTHGIDRDLTLYNNYEVLGVVNSCPQYLFPENHRLQATVRDIERHPYFIPCPVHAAEERGFIMNYDLQNCHYHQGTTYEPHRRTMVRYLLPLMFGIGTDADIQKHDVLAARVGGARPDRLFVAFKIHMVAYVIYCFGRGHSRKISGWVELFRYKQADPEFYHCWILPTLFLVKKAMDPQNQIDINEVLNCNVTRHHQHLLTNLKKDGVWSEGWVERLITAPRVDQRIEPGWTKGLPYCIMRYCQLMFKGFPREAPMGDVDPRTGNPLKVMNRCDPHEMTAMGQPFLGLQSFHTGVLGIHRYR